MYVFVLSKFESNFFGYYALLFCYDEEDAIMIVWFMDFIFNVIWYMAMVIELVIWWAIMRMGRSLKFKSDQTIKVIWLVACKWIC